MISFLGWIIIALIVWIIIKNRSIPRTLLHALSDNSSIIAAVISINIMSLLDSTSTLFLVGQNYSNELNPVMNALIDYHPGLFVLVKMAITLGGTLVCLYYYERKKRARTILKLTHRAYTFLMIYHCVLLTSVLI